MLPDPPKTCAFCGGTMKRKRYNGRLEDRARFRKRQHCDQTCMAGSMEGTIKVSSPRNSRKQTAKQRASKCATCGSTLNLHAHHVNHDPMDNRPSNIQTLCARCHRRLHSQHSRAMQGPPKRCKHCEMPARHNGLCNTHWTRFRRSGDPLLRRERHGGQWVWVKDDG